MATVTFDGHTYPLEDLSDEARTLYRGVQFADQKLQELKENTAMLQTAGQSYASDIGIQLPEPVQASDQKEQITIDDKAYELASLPEDAKQKIHALQRTDQRISELKAEVSLIQTARNTYIQALQLQLSNKTFAK